MIFLASVQESLSVMGLMPRSDGLSLMAIRLEVVVGGATTREDGDLEEVEEEVEAEDPAQVELVLRAGGREDNEDEG